VGRSRPDMRTCVTSARFKVKVKIMEVPKLQKLHFSRSGSSAVLVWSSKLTVVDDSMGPGQAGLQPVKSDFRISFQESYHESSNFAECRYFTKFKWPYFGIA